MVATLTEPVASQVRHPTSSSRHNSMSKFDPDGRRQLFGLSQAIRKHAYQSTSPSSEFKYGRKMCQSYDTLATSRPRNPAKTPPTIEERLRNLLNSDTEGAEGQTSPSTSKRTFDRPPTFELASKGFQGSYSPRLAESRMRAERLNRTAGDQPSDSTIEVQKLKQRTRSLSSERSLPPERPRTPACRVMSNSPGPCIRKTQPGGGKLRARRCVSAVPAAFYDENWNVVPESPKRDDTSGSQFMFAPRSPVSTSTPTGRQTPTSVVNQAIWNQRPPPSPKRALPVTGHTRSDVKTPDGTPTRRTLEYTPSSLPMAAGDKSSDGKQQQTRPLFRLRKKPQVPPLSPLIKDNAFGDQTPSTPSPLRQSSPTKFGHTVERKSRPIQYAEPPSPAYVRTSMKAAPGSITDSGLRVSSVTSMSSQNSVPVPTKRSISAPRFTTLPHEHRQPRSPDKIGAGVHSPDDDPESCKSEDRDSGAILDAEASVFDFDSSVISESEDEASQNTQKQTQSPVTLENLQRNAVWSRSSTPTLPPLSPYASDEDTPRNSEPQDSGVAATKQQQVQSPIRNEVAQLPSYESLVRKRRAVAKKEKSPGDDSKDDVASGESHDHHELSPTESALADSCERQKAAISTKNPEVKVVTKTAEKRNQRHRITRGSSHASSCDEQRVVSHARHRVGKKINRKGQRRHQKSSEEYTHYDIEDTKASKQKLGRYPVFYRPGDDGVEGSRDAEETSSVRSFTSASVTSSVFRKGGKRHHRRHHGHGAYTKEVRAVNKRFSRLEAHVVTLARSVAQMSSEMRQQNETARDIEELRAQIEELRQERRIQGEPTSSKSSSSSRSKTETSRATLNSKAHPKRVSKLTKFFGEKPPILSLFLAQLGYEKYIENFNAESISMVELAYMDEETLKRIGIPLGPRIRILNEAKKTCFV